MTTKVENKQINVDVKEGDAGNNRKCFKGKRAVSMLNSNVKLHKMKRDKCSLDLASWRLIVTLTGAISIMCGARRKPGWGLLRKECEMKFD